MHNKMVNKTLFPLLLNYWSTNLSRILSGAPFITRRWPEGLSSSSWMESLRKDKDSDVIFQRKRALVRHLPFPFGELVSQSSTWFKWKWHWSWLDRTNIESLLCSRCVCSIRLSHVLLLWYTFLLPFLQQDQLHSPPDHLYLSHNRFSSFLTLLICSLTTGVIKHAGSPCFGKTSLLFTRWLRSSSALVIGAVTDTSTSCNCYHTLEQNIKKSLCLLYSMYYWLFATPLEFNMSHNWVFGQTCSNLR